MGKGDQRTRRGKIFAGSHGKTRPKHKNPVIIPAAKPKPATAVVKEKPMPKVRKKAATVVETENEAPAADETPETAVEEASAVDETTETPETTADETPAGEVESTKE